MDSEVLAIEGSLAGERALAPHRRLLSGSGHASAGRRLAALGDNHRPTPVRVVQHSCKKPGEVLDRVLVGTDPLRFDLDDDYGGVIRRRFDRGRARARHLGVADCRPVPRLALLFAKYVAVMVVAMLTATVNLVAMAATISLSGLGMLVWGNEAFRRERSERLSDCCSSWPVSFQQSF